MALYKFFVIRMGCRYQNKSNCRSAIMEEGMREEAGGQVCIFFFIPKSVHIFHHKSPSDHIFHCELNLN